jgi:hypothetical protein
MASYVSSNDNRFYVAAEQTYGKIPAITAANRIPAVKLSARQRVEKSTRKDKTGTRTFWGDPSSLKRSTQFGLKTYMTGWTDTTHEPGYGPLFAGCLGSSASIWNGGTVASVVSQTRLAFTSPHGLLPGQAISIGGELRFVSAVIDAFTIQLVAPFSLPPTVGTTVGATATYQLASELPSATIFDYWSPATAVQRLMCGVALNQMKININGDFHEFDFSGEAADILDSASFSSGQGSLTAFPDEPALQPLAYSLIPGHLGQAWLGSTTTQFFTVTKASLTLNNNLSLRDHEFGTQLARGITPGIREVALDMSLYQQDDTGTQALYQAARQRSPICVMLQLGQQQGELFALYLKSVVPEVPELTTRTSDSNGI